MNRRRDKKNCRKSKSARTISPVGWGHLLRCFWYHYHVAEMYNLARLEHLEHPRSPACATNSEQAWLNSSLLYGSDESWLKAATHRTGRLDGPSRRLVCRWTRLDGLRRPSARVLKNVARFDGRLDGPSRRTNIIGQICHYSVLWQPRRL